MNVTRSSSQGPPVLPYPPQQRHAPQAAFCFLVIALAVLCGSAARVRAATVSADGAVDVNIAYDQGTSSVWYIELQRTGADFIRDGVSQKNSALIQSGIVVLNWGFNHQAADGSFPGTAGGSTGQMFHSTAIFVDAAAKATLQLKAYDPATYADVITNYTAHLQAIADWLTLPNVAAAGQFYNLRFTHRRYMLASALAQVAQLVDDAAEADKLNAAADDYARAGLALMMPEGSRAVIVHNPDWSVPPATLLTPDQPSPPQVDGEYARGVHVISAWGVNPESYGYDVSYQMVGVQYAERYYEYCDNDALKAQVADMIDRACRWEISRINHTDDILTIGTSRIGLEKNRDGSIKGVSPSSIKSGLLIGYSITGDTRLLDAANRLKSSRFSFEASPSPFPIPSPRPAVKIC